MTRPCKSCGQLFQTRCLPRPTLRRDGTWTTRWTAVETECDACRQPALFDAHAADR